MAANDLIVLVIRRALALDAQPVTVQLVSAEEGLTAGAGDCVLSAVVAADGYAAAVRIAFGEGNSRVEHEDNVPIPYVAVKRKSTKIVRGYIDADLLVVTVDTCN